MEHSVRRTREKLRVMVETPHLSWILGDMIDVLWEDLFGEEYKSNDGYKIQLVERLKNRYEKIIREAETIPPKQGNLGI